jgi:hypothetical protein
MHRRQSSGRRRRRFTHGLGWTTPCLLLLLAGLSGSSASSDRLSQIRLVGYGGVGAYPQAAPGDTGSVPVAAGHASKMSLSITGSVVGLYPGATLPLVLTVTNTKAQAIKVTSIATAVGKASKLCGAYNVHVTTFSGKLLVPAGAKATTTVEVLMVHAATNACQGAVFPFRYHGLASAS